MKYKNIMVVFIACFIAVGLICSSISTAAVPKLNELISTDSNGVKVTQINNNKISMSDDSRYVVFMTSTSLSSDDTNLSSDAYVKDRTNNATTLASVANTGLAVGNVSAVSISYTGRYISFVTSTSASSNDTGTGADVYVRDMQGASTELISHHSGLASNNANNPQISADGRFVVYVTLDTNPIKSSGLNYEIYVKDRTKQTFELLSKDINGGRSNDVNSTPAINCDGSIITFSSNATNLVPNDTNAKTDIFLVNRTGGHDIRNLTLSGNNNSYIGGLSCDGNFASFSSEATNLVLNDTNSREDGFRYNRLTDTTELISKSTSGQIGNGKTTGISLSGDGRYVVFSSASSNLVSGDTANESIFQRDTITGVTEILSVTTTGSSANYNSSSPKISVDGRYVAYVSSSTNLVSNDPDTNNDAYVSKTGY
jgi:hypothetical protein